MPNKHDYMNKKAVASMLGVSTDTVDRLRKSDPRFPPEFKLPMGRKYRLVWRCKDVGLYAELVRGIKLKTITDNPNKMRTFHAPYCRIGVDKTEKWWQQ